MNTYDTIIIGFGQGPKLLAKKLRAHGESVLSIESNKERYGGACFTVGCLPTKSLLDKSKKMTTLSPKEHYRESIFDKVELVEGLRSIGYHEIADSGAKVVNGVGSFIDNNHVKVTYPDGNSEIYHGKKILINTGATPIIPNISGLKESNRVFTTDQLLDKVDLPDRLTIIGSGTIGLEFATIYNNFGSRVTLIDSNSEFMPSFDRATAEAVYNELQNEGIRIILNATVREIQDMEQCSKLFITKNEEPIVLDTDAILIATGRRPNIDKLNLDATDLEYTRNGIKHNEHLETNVPGIFVGGDVKGGPQLTSISLADNRIISNYLYGDGQITKKTEESTFPSTIFMNTPLSHIGMSAEEAKKAGYTTLTNYIPASRTLKGHITGNKHGFVKIVVDSDSHEILGATFYIEDSPELINMISLVMHEHLPYESLSQLIYTHPSSSETLLFLLSGLK